ncbi:MAG: DUF4340 domain-containing protein [Chloroflexi bacterium]|nr:DUF4340 domain-containing protein [Chloroflexota bacterium]
MTWRKNVILFVLVVAVGSVLYFQQQREDIVEELPPATLAPPPPEQFSVVDTTIDDVQGLSVTRNSDDLLAVFIREADGNWRQTVPEETAVISQTMNTQMIGVINLATRRTFSADSSPLSDFGLDSPNYKVSIASLDRGATIRTTIHIGNLTPADDGYYIQVEGDPRIHIVPRGPLDNMIDLPMQPPVLNSPGS